MSKTFHESCFYLKPKWKMNYKFQFSFLNLSYTIKVVHVWEVLDCLDAANQDI